MNENVEKRIDNMETVMNKLIVVTQQLNSDNQQLNTNQLQLNDRQITIAEIFKEMVTYVKEEVVQENNNKIQLFRAEVSQNIDSMKSQHQQDMESLSTKIEEIKKQGLTVEQLNMIEKERRLRIIHLLNGTKSDKYVLFKCVYFAYLGEVIKNTFKNSDSKIYLRYLDPSKFNSIVDFIRHWTPDKETKKKLRDRVVSEMLELKDTTDELKDKIDNNKSLRESDKLTIAVQINKNEKILKKFNTYMNRITREDK